VDLALDRLGALTTALAVNIHHGAPAMDAHLADGIHRSLEEPVALGTAGALGLLQAWIAGRDVVVTNADAWLPSELDLAGFVADWDRERVRLLCVDDPARGDFGSARYCGVALMPARLVGRLEPVPTGLYEVCWREEAAHGRLDLVVHGAPFVDCGSPADYLRANLLASRGDNVIGDRARIGSGARLERTVVWDGSAVADGEILVDAVRAETLTVFVRS